jgi:hypothetical protein
MNIKICDDKDMYKDLDMDTDTDTDTNTDTDKDTGIQRSWIFCCQISVNNLI